jgi:CHAD domain-containing protein
MKVVEAFVLLATSISDEAVDRVGRLNASAAPEDLHKLRVALRRLRTLWWAYEPLLDKQDAKLQRREFKSLADAAGRTRDWDVLHELIAASDPSNEQALTLLIEAIEAHRADALSFSLRAIGNAGVERILEQALASARQQLELQGAGRSIASFAEERVQARPRRPLKSASNARYRRTSQTTRRFTRSGSRGKNCATCCSSFRRFWMEVIRLLLNDSLWCKTNSER